MLFSKIPAYLIDSENVGSTWTSLLQSDERFEIYIFVTENAKSLNFMLLKELTDSRHRIHIVECEPGKNSLDFYLSSYLGYLIGKNAHSAYTVVSQDTGYDHVIEYWNKEGNEVVRINTKVSVEKKTAVRKRENRNAGRTETKANSETRVIAKKKTPEIKEEKKAEPKKEIPAKKPEKAKAPEKKTEPVKKENNDLSLDRHELLVSLLPEQTPEDIEAVSKVLDSVPEDKREDKNLVYHSLVRRFKKQKGLAIYSLIKKDLKKYYRLSETKTA